MSPLNSTSVIARLGSVALAAALCLALGAPAAADDRDLFQLAQESPYVMMLLDTSGSMNSMLDGSRQLGDQANPGSRFYQAKAAVYDVVKDLDPRIRLGFAHFPQHGNPRHEVDRKHYLYKRSPGQSNPPWWDVLQWPLETDHVAFGRWVVDGDNSNYLWCNTGTNVRERLNAFPKLNHQGVTTTTIYTSNVGGNGQILRVRFTGLPAGVLGQPNISVQVNVTAINSDCSLATGLNARSQTMTIDFEPAFIQDGDGKPFLDASGNPVAFDYHSRYDHHGVGTILDWTRSSECSLPNLWEPNENNATGTNTTQSQLSYTTQPDPFNRDPSDGAFDRGDVIPWDWRGYPQTIPTPGFEHSTRNEILFRLAPNTRITNYNTVPPTRVEAHIATAADVATYPGAVLGEPVPIFRSAYYFNKEPVSGVLGLRAPYVNHPPIFVGVNTPLAGMMNETADWFDEWRPFAADPFTGDPDFQCRERFVILLTDGVETCGGNPGAAAANLYSRGVRTFVVGFGPGVTAGALQDIARQGGTGTDDNDSQAPSEDPGDGRDCNDFNTWDEVPPGSGNFVQTGFDFCTGAPVGVTPATPSNGVIVAATKQDLVDGLERIFTSLQGTATSFASAAVPAAQVETEKSIFLTSFTPQDATNRWPGALAHFIRPLPTRLNSQGNYVPDFSQVCSGPNPSSCLAWEAGPAMLPQAPPDDPSTASWNDIAIDIDPTVVTPAAMLIGDGQNRRRILYGRDRGNGGNQVGYQHRRFHPQPTLAREYDMWTAMGITFTVGDTASELAARKEAAKVMRDVVLQKTAIDPVTSTPFDYILGDLFHSDPVQIGGPLRPEYLAANLPAGSSTDCTVSTRGYRCFFEKHKYRRQVVLAGSNDGMVHALDAGRFQSNVVGGQQKGTFGLGTGMELFAYIPREEMANLYDLKFNNSNRHEYSVDGPIRVDDVFIDPSHTGTPTASEREWRTIAIGGLREGGNSYYALDVTQPDVLTTINGEEVPTSANYVPSCITSSYNTTDCGPRRYGTTLWEFSDPDLGNTWSLPNTGRIQVLDSSGALVTKFVAIFGGGLDPDNPTTVGNHLYMVDMETGHYIYKRALDAGAPSDPAAVDTDGDSLLDTIYIGTVGGSMYKVDISTPISMTTLPNGNPGLQDPLWDPFKVFDTGARPIFFPPSVLFVGDLGRYALAFGTGDREDMWNTAVSNQEGRFHVLVDDGWTSSMAILDETDFEIIDADAAAPTTPQNYLVSPNSGNSRGFTLTLEPGEKVVTRSFALSGVTAFNTFTPDTSANAGLCERNGFGRVYTIFTATGVGLQQDSVTSQSKRYRQTPEPVFSNPFTEVSSGNNTSGTTANDLTSDLERIRDELKTFQPPNCRFTAQTINIQSVRSDTGIEFIAPVPICVIQKNWKEGPFQ